MVHSIQDLKDVCFSARSNKSEMEAIARHIWIKQSQWIPEILKECLNTKENGGYRLRAAWLATTGFELFPKSYQVYEENVIATMLAVKDSSERRSLVRIVAQQGHSKIYDELLIDWLFQLIQNVNEAIAVKAHGISILERIVFRVPELANEFVETLDSQWQNASPGIKNRIGHAKNRLKKKGFI